MNRAWASYICCRRKRFELFSTSIFLLNLVSSVCFFFLFFITASMALI